MVKIFKCLMGLFSFVSLLGYAEEFTASISPITDEIFLAMSYSWNEKNPVPLEDLRVVSVTYWNFDGQATQGSLIIHEKVATEVVEIFQDLFEDRFPIEKILFVDEYQGIDELSARDNNSYSFCCRPITGSVGGFSKHSYGLAIDLNPLYNPYLKGDLLVPATSGEYLDRSRTLVKGMIHRDTACYKAFTKRGWKWGGDWEKTKGYVDFHHFEKDPKEVLKGE